LTEAIVLIHTDNGGMYGYGKLHVALARERIEVGEDQSGV
jgi:hypothetical protein